MDRPTLPAPAMTTRIVRPPCGGRCARTSARPATSGTSSSPAIDVHAGRRPGSTVSASGTIPSPSRNRNATRPPAASSIVPSARPTQPRCDVHLDEHDVPRGSRNCGAAPGGQQPAQHLVGRPADRGDGRDAQPLVDLGAAGVVDPGDDVVDAERLAGHPGRQDVGVVAAAETAAKASASSMPASSRASRSKPTPVTVRPSKPGRAGGTRRGRGR